MQLYRALQNDEPSVTSISTIIRMRGLGRVLSTMPKKMFRYFLSSCLCGAIICSLFVIIIPYERVDCLMSVSVNCVSQLRTAYLARTGRRRSLGS